MRRIARAIRADIAEQGDPYYTLGAALIAAGIACGALSILCMAWAAAT